MKIETIILIKNQLIIRKERKGKLIRQKISIQKRKNPIK